MCDLFLEKQCVYLGGVINFEELTQTQRFLLDAFQLAYISPFMQIIYPDMIWFTTSGGRRTLLLILG